MDNTLLWVLWGLGSLIGAYLLLQAFLYLGRGSPIERVRLLENASLPGAGEEGFHRVVEAYVSTELRPNSRAEILFNGEEVYPRLFEDLRSARDLIAWHVFWFKPGKLADQLLEILCERARAGVDVFFLYDHFGGWGVDDRYWEALREAGCEVNPFRPWRWNRLYKWQQRSHMRTVIIDGRVGYTGGFAIHDDWMGDGRHPGQWRDTSARIGGDLVRRLQTAFIIAWADATGDLLLGDRLFPEETEVEGPHRAGLLFNAPSIGSTDAERYFALSIRGAKQRLYITNAYVLPNGAFRHLLTEAVDRGVDVRVLTPGANTDQPSTWYAARCHYQELLNAGVRIWEYEPTMVHAKTLVADGAWCSVGTINFDNRSISLNDEITLLAQGRDLGDRLQSRFLEDLEFARELDAETFRGRNIWERTKERFWVLFSRIL